MSTTNKQTLQQINTVGSAHTRRTHQPDAEKQSQSKTTNSNEGNIMKDIFTPANIAALALYATFETSNSLAVQAIAITSLVALWLGREFINAQFAR